MPDDARIQLLLDELLDSQSTPEEVCGRCPELLPEVRARWRRICRTRDELDAVFPPMPVSRETIPCESKSDAPLPKIPGYEVESMLGMGGMGVVFRARHTRLNRIVALKMALAGAYGGPRERQRFQREAEAVAALRHPNVVQVHDVGESDGRPYFTMEYIEGGSLARKLNGTPLAARGAATLLANLAAAVHAAHAAGIIHRDLKPANVLLTSEGIPKVSDFGLARRLDGEAGLTRTGTGVGTPSYMAPEQARGGPDAVGPPADIYSLGAILYEMLTGRPPFRAETGAETVHQLLTQDPVPPTRLNLTVPRDLETVCLKCLHKEPRLRYATTASLAEDLGRFLRGETVMARPEGPLARLCRRVRRRPMFSGTIALCALLAMALLGVGLWMVADYDANVRAARAAQAAKEAAVGQDLDEMDKHMRALAWSEARAALERARGRLGEAGPTELGRRIERGALDLDLVARLEAIRFECFGINETSPEVGKADHDYEEAFRRARLGRPGEDDPAVLAAWLKSSPIAPVLVAALETWASCCYENRDRQARLREAARGADPESAKWWIRATDPATWKDDAAIAQLIETALTANVSLPVLMQIVYQMIIAGKDPVPFLLRAQATNPGEFWVNMMLASQLYKSDPREAVRFYQAAVAIRPGAASIQTDLGAALLMSGRPKEAEAHFRRALELAPTFANAQTCLAVFLSRQERYDKAIEQVRSAFRHGIRTAGLFTALGYSEEAKGRPNEALEAFREAIALDPNLLAAHLGLRGSLMKQGRFEEAMMAWVKALDVGPREHTVWDGCAEFCLFLGHNDLYHRVSRDLLDRFETSKDPQVAERTSRACLLMPVPAEEAERAAALIDRALAADKDKSPAWARSYYLVTKALAEYRLDRPETAISVLNGDPSKVLIPLPQLVQAMAEHRLGRKAAARKTFATAILSFDWRTSQATNREVWMYHALRREAEKMILPNLPAFLEGKYQPQENDERIGFLGVCLFTDRNRSLARLYAEAFDADPRLADQTAGHRYKAAVAAALCGCGRGEDAGNTSEVERVKWRARAREWLRADLAAWIKAMETNPNTYRILANRRFEQWLADPDLAGLREATELEKLPAIERKACHSLWAEVGEALKRTVG